MDFKYKAIFVDLDGTLLNSHKKISQKNLDCLNKQIENGIHVVIATGRTLKSVKKVTEGLNVETPVITLNGSDIKKSIDGYSMRLSYIDNKLRDIVFSLCKNIINGAGEGAYKIQNILVDTANGFYCLHPGHIDIEEFTYHYDVEVQDLDLDNLPSEPIVSFSINS